MLPLDFADNLDACVLCRYHQHYWLGLVTNQSSSPGRPVAGSRFVWLDPLGLPLAKAGSYQQWGTWVAHLLLLLLLLLTSLLVLKLLKCLKRGGEGVFRNATAGSLHDDCTLLYW
jgi:hypothetical protein